MVIEAQRDIEKDLLTRYPIVIGIDEVGRGALAGPVVVAAVVTSRAAGEPPPGLRDSKLLSAARREALAPLCASWATAWAIGEATPAEIDAQGIVWALQSAASRALAEIAQRLDLRGGVILLDGTHNWISDQHANDLPVLTRAKADRDCTVVAAASVIAKVQRDRDMVRAHQHAPGYHWAGNKGYGSPSHLAAIAQHGPHPMHRRTWLRALADPSAAGLR